MQSKFREDKTTEAAVFLIKLHGNTTNYMMLIKLLYLADREALLTLGRPITYDRYFSMDKGPVLSYVLEKINEGDPPDTDSIWSKHISVPCDYSVSVKLDIEQWELSNAEIGILEKVYREHGGKDKWELVRELHKILPEWRDPKGSALPIHYKDILEAGGMDRIDIEAVLGELELIAVFEASL